jgi:murein L,D-transpeptidase YafK
MEINFKCEIMEKYYKIIGIFLAALIFGVVFLWNNNSYLKSETKKNAIEYKELEKEKTILSEEIKLNRQEIQRKDSIILVLTNKEKSLLETLKTQKNENSKNTFDYLNSSNDERFILFSRLATEKSNAK